MQTAGQKPLQEMNDNSAVITEDCVGANQSIPTNYAKSFQRLTDILKVYIAPKKPKMIIFTNPEFLGLSPINNQDSHSNKPLLIEKIQDNKSILSQTISLLFHNAIHYGKKKATIDIVFEDDSFSTLYVGIESGELLDKLTITGQMIPIITHEMHDLSELAGRYNIDPNESLVSVKEKISEHLNEKYYVTHFELDQNYLECLVEQQPHPD